MECQRPGRHTCREPVDLTEIVGLENGDGVLSRIEYEDPLSFSIDQDPVWLGADGNLGADLSLDGVDCGQRAG